MIVCKHVLYVCACVCVCVVYAAERRLCGCALLTGRSSRQFVAQVNTVEGTAFAGANPACSNPLLKTCSVLLGDTPRIHFVNAPSPAAVARCRSDPADEEVHLQKYHQSRKIKHKTRASVQVNRHLEPDRRLAKSQGLDDNFGERNRARLPVQSVGLLPKVFCASVLNLPRRGRAEPRVLVAPFTAVQACHPHLQHPLVMQLPRHLPHPRPPQAARAPVPSSAW